MDEYTKALLKVVVAARNIYRVTSTAWSRNAIPCPHGNVPSYPTHAWWCDKCWFALKDAIQELEQYELSQAEK